MPSPFPGMDPYLESPEIWPDVHHGIISLTQRALNPSLRPKYVARVELRVYVSNEDDPGRSVVIPDVRIDKSRSRNGARTRTASSSAIAEAVVVPMVAEEEIEEAYLEIRHLASKKLVTIIEVLSPSNKIRGSSGRASFLSKRKEALASKVHWVEIDLMPGADRRCRCPPRRTATIASWCAAATTRPRPVAGPSVSASPCRSSPFRCGIRTPMCRSIWEPSCRSVTSTPPMICPSTIAKSPTRPWPAAAIPGRQVCCAAAACVRAHNVRGEVYSDPERQRRAAAALRWRFRIVKGVNIQP